MIRLTNQYEMTAWIAAMHAALMNKNAYTPQVIGDAGKAADTVAMMFRARCPEAFTGVAEPKDAVGEVIDNAMGIGARMPNATDGKKAAE
jgi:hypothetical protein